MPIIPFRVTDDEAAAVQQEAAARGMTVSHLVRFALALATRRAEFLAPRSRGGPPKGSRNNPHGRPPKPRT